MFLSPQGYTTGHKPFPVSDRDVWIDADLPDVAKILQSREHQSIFPTSMKGLSHMRKQPRTSRTAYVDGHLWVSEADDSPVSGTASLRSRSMSKTVMLDFPRPSKLPYER